MFYNIDILRQELVKEIHGKFAKFGNICIFFGGILNSRWNVGKRAEKFPSLTLKK
jgi:hypothetical protein